MDLNKAMVEMYKKRTSASKSRRPVGKKPKVEHDLSKNDLSSSKVTSEKELSHFEEVISALDYRPTTTFDKLHGCNSAQNQILNIVKRFQRSLTGQSKKSEWPVLISGSRGLGKTSLVEAAAQYSNLNLVPIFLKSLVEQSRSEFKTTLQQILIHCERNQPAIVLVDDLDQINDKEDLRYMIRGTIRRLMSEQQRLLVFCTTSSIVDNAHGIDFLFTIQLRRPDMEARYKILNHLKESNLNLKSLSDHDLKDLAIATPSFTALDIKKMLDIAETGSSGEPSKKDCDKAVEVIKRSFKRGTHLIGEKPAITWKDIGGLAEVRHSFIDIMKQIKKGDINCKFAGIALYGPPGCGKTMVAQAMANEAGLNFISIKPAELVDKFLGETEKNIRRVFSEAQEFEPCMIYFDEFDGLCGTRGNRDNITSAIQTLLSEMDGFTGRGKSIILASTNRLEDIDPAMKRPGRLSKHIYVGPPNEQARKDILNVITQKPSLSLANDIDLNEWAKKTENFTGADLDFLIAEAESRAISQLQVPENVNDDNDQVIIINQEQLQYALEKIRVSNKELGKKTIIKR